MATFKEALTTSLTNFAKSIAKTYPKTANIVDNLLSTDSTLPLSAKQGNVLQKQIDTLNSNLNGLNGFIILDDSSASDPGGYISGNYIGWTESDGVQSLWFQLDANIFQMQMMVANVTHQANVRVKYLGVTSWDGITWTGLN